MRFGDASSSWSASWRWRSARNSGRGASAPGLAAWRSIAVRICAASKSSGRNARGRRPSKQVVDVPAQSTRVHGLSSSLICAALLQLCGVVDLCRKSQRTVLEHLGVGDADPHVGGGLLDRTALQEPQFQNPTVLVGQRVEQLGDALRRGADRLLAFRRRFDVVDRRDLVPERRAPVRGENGSRGRAQVAADLADAGGKPQRPQGREKDLRGEVFGIGAVADAGEDRPVHPGGVVLVDGLPIRIAVAADYPQWSRAGGVALCRHCVACLFGDESARHGGRRLTCP